MTNTGVSAGSAEYQRQWREANAEHVREYRQRYQQENAERIRENQRQYYQKNAERIRERVRQRRQAADAADPAQARERRRRNYQATRDWQLEYQRQRRRNGYKSPRQRRAAETTANLWHEQDGCCYLCKIPIALDQAVLEHDHRCCPKENTFCAYCVRGAACSACNQAIGLMHDDPDLMERVAHNLRIKLAETDKRLAAKPVQAPLAI